MAIFRSLSALLLLLSCGTSLASTWPQELESDSGDLIRIFQPQIESFSGNTLEARTAISVETASTSGPMFGAIWMVARLDSDRSSRTAVIRDIDVTTLKQVGEMIRAGGSAQVENLPDKK